MTFLLLLLTLLQSPDELAEFLAALEKERAGGAAAETLLQKIDAWAQGKPAETTARLAWNRGSLESTLRINSLFVEGLKRRIGKEVILGRSKGILREVKSDRIVLGITGGTIDLELSVIPFDVRLDDVKKEGLLPAKSVEEAIYRFSENRSVPGMAAARALPEGEARNKALAAIAGWVLQEADRGLAAGATLKVAEELAARWAKEKDLLAAADGAIRTFIDATLGKKLLAEAEALLEKDRKGARKLLDLAAALCRAEEIVKAVAERRWDYLEKGEWMKIALDSFEQSGGKLKGGALFWEDTSKEKRSVAGMSIEELPIAWEDISGVRAKVKPKSAELIDMRFEFGEPRRVHSVVVAPDDKWGYHVHYQGAESKVAAGSTRTVDKKAEYELVAQWDAKKWKLTVSGTEIDTFTEAGVPNELGFSVCKGGAELVSLEIRKK